MRSIVIDIRPLLPKHPPGGVPEYTKELVRAILGVIRSENLKVPIFLFSSGRERPNVQFLETYKELFRPIHLNIPNRALNASFKFLGYPKIDTFIPAPVQLPDDITFFAPNINLFPLSPRAKLVVTFHDFSFERYPFFLAAKERLWHKMIAPRTIAKRADKIIVVSESTKQDLIRLYGIESSKIEVVYSGVNKKSQKSKRVSPFLRNDKSQKYKSKVKTILYLGSTAGRKNVEALLCAFAIVKKRLRGEKLKLVIAGPPHNPVSEEKKRELYQNADLFVYPSLFEGFGLPPLEAMRYGVPVITGNTSSLPEVMGDAVLMVNPHRIDELARAIEILLTDEKLRAHYARKGLARTKQFTWEKAARETLKILLSV